MKRRYTLLLEPNPDGGPYTVTVPMLPGCITQRDTVEEAIERAQEAIQVHIMGLRMDDEEIPEGEGPFQLADIEVDVGDIEAVR